MAKTIPKWVYYCFSHRKTYKAADAGIVPVNKIGNSQKHSNHGYCPLSWKILWKLNKAIGKWISPSKQMSHLFASNCLFGYFPFISLIFLGFNPYYQWIGLKICKSTMIFMGNRWCPGYFPLNQSIDTTVIKVNGISGSSNWGDIPLYKPPI